MAKSKTSTYVLSLKLDIQPFQEDIIDKRLEIARNIQNNLINVILKRYNLMTESKKYNKLQKQLKIINSKYHNCNISKSKNDIQKTRKLLYKELQEIYIEFGLTNYSLYEDVKPMYNHFKDNIGSLEAQAIADKVWKSLDKLLNSNGDKIYFKRFGEVNSIENKWNKSGLKYEDGSIKWKDICIPVIIKNNNTYAQMAIQDKVKYVRIIRKLIRGKSKYYVQLVMEGIPPKKIDKETGEIKHYVNDGRVGLDIGTRTIGICSDKDVKLLELAPEVDNIENKKKILMRKLDRQRRVNNHNNYNEDGTIKKGIRMDGKLTKLKWHKSNKYIKTQNELRENQRKQTAIRKQSHEKLANYILELGNEVYVETMNYKGLQKRSKETTVNEKTGKFNKKKRFGKSLANKAPSMLLEIISRKLGYNGLTLLKINTYKAKASQYNHFNDEYNKKELKNRWNDDVDIQRDLYAAFLIMNVNEDLETINREKCIETYCRFKELHDIEIQRLKHLKNNGIKLISSIGI